LSILDSTEEEVIPLKWESVCGGNSCHYHGIIMLWGKIKIAVSKKSEWHPV
jgi:hypothetical protein